VQGMAASTLLAGCTGGGDATRTNGGETDTVTDTETATETETATATETSTEPEPTTERRTVENFAYPEGASREGVDAATLYRTHRSSIVDAGSVTVEVERSTDRGSRTSSITQTNKFGSAGVSRETARSSLTETLWSPSGDDQGYVRMSTGFEDRYRIDNAAPDPQTVIELRLFESLLAGATWSEAKTVVEANDGHAVVYESTGVANERRVMDGTVFGDAVSEFTAEIAVSESGLVARVEYDVTVERESRAVRQQASVANTSLGDTTVPEPSWSDTARADGVQFSVDLTDDSRLIAAEMTNGTSIDADASVNLSSRQFGTGSLGESLAEGQTLYVGLSDQGDLVTGVDERPTGTEPLNDFVFFSVRAKEFLLLEAEFRL